MLASSLSSRAGARPCAAGRARRPQRHCVVRTKALFGWGKKAEEEDQYDAKADELLAQQELLAKRRSGVLLKEANERRQKVQETLKSKQDLRKAEKQALAEGRVPESLASWQPYDKKTLENASKPGIIVPLLPFGIKKYDEGERFDLRSPYADEGWVDPEETDMWAGFKAAGQKLLNFGQYKEVKNKPVVWASQYGKYVADQKAKKEEEEAQRAAEAEGKNKRKT